MTMKSTVNREKKGGGGRPPKFHEASRPVTVTLPERTLGRLEAVSPDRAKAIVKCVEAAIGGHNQSREPVELVEVLPGKALIVVGPSRLLGRISWLRRVEMAPARYLLVLPVGTSVESLEVEILDLMNTLGPKDADERDLLEKLHALLGDNRRRRAISKAELIFVDVART